MDKQEKINEILENRNKFRSLDVAVLEDYTEEPIPDPSPRFTKLMDIYYVMNENDLFEINLLKFHRLGQTKWEQLGLEYEYATKGDMEMARSWARALGMLTLLAAVMCRTRAVQSESAYIVSVNSAGELAASLPAAEKSVSSRRTCR